MMSTPDRQAAVLLIQEAVRSGARKRCACAELGLTLRTFERWTRDGGIASDTRPMAVRPVPANALSAQERTEVLAVANSPRFADLPPTQIVPRLADEGRYLASESTFYRLLRAEKQLTHRGRAKAPQTRSVPRHCATGPNQLYACPPCGLYRLQYSLSPPPGHSGKGHSRHRHPDAMLQTVGLVANLAGIPRQEGESRLQFQ